MLTIVGRVLDQDVHIPTTPHALALIQQHDVTCAYVPESFAVWDVDPLSLTNPHLRPFRGVFLVSPIPDDPTRVWLKLHLSVDGGPPQSVHCWLILVEYRDAPVYGDMRWRASGRFSLEIRERPGASRAGTKEEVRRLYDAMRALERDRRWGRPPNPVAFDSPELLYEAILQTMAQLITDLGHDPTEKEVAKIFPRRTTAPQISRWASDYGGWDDLLRIARTRVNPGK